MSSRPATPPGPPHRPGTTVPLPVPGPGNGDERSMGLPVLLPFLFLSTRIAGTSAYGRASLRKEAPNSPLEVVIKHGVPGFLYFPPPSPA
jgi:hypothetical protein